MKLNPEYRANECTKTWRVYYYRNYRTISHKDVKAETSEQAIKRARAKNIISLQVIDD